MKTIPLSAPLARLHAQASAAGLACFIEDNGSDHVLQSYTLRITRRQVDPPANMLDVVNNNADTITVQAVRCFNEGKWSHSVRKYGYAGKPYTMPLRQAKYAIEGMAR